MQQFLDANPVLVIVGLFVVGIIMVLAARIVLETAGCLAQVGCLLVVLVAIFLLLRFLLFHI